MRCISPITIKNPAKLRDSLMVTVPCQRCGACRHNRRIEWSFRLKEEFRKAKTAHFVTLTYNDETLPRDTETYLPTVEKADCQKFLKRLRKRQAKRTDEKIRYYIVGEYGTDTHRPHYHAILFNVVRTTDIIDSWKLGHTMVGTVQDESIHYVTKYHVNFRKEIEGRADEFSLMSRKPGIGIDYIKRAGKWNEDNGNVYVMNNGFPQRMPRYYKEKIFSEGQRKRLAKKQISESDEKYRKEILRLDKLGIKNPSEYMETSAYLQSLKIEDKAKKQDKL